MQKLIEQRNLLSMSVRTSDLTVQRNGQLVRMYVSFTNSRLNISNLPQKISKPTIVKSVYPESRITGSIRGILVE